MFRTFRKNKKTWLATLGVLAMFSFVFIPAFQEGAGYRYGSAQNKVVSTSFGSLNEMDLSNLRVERQTFVAFLNALAGAFMQDYASLQNAAMQAGDVAENPMLPKLQEYSRVIQKLRTLEQRLSRTDETSLVNDWLQARYAEKTGIVINNETIADFVKSLTSGLATSQQLELAVEQIRLTNPKQLDDSIRELLLGSEYRRLFAANFKEMPLSKQWDYFCRVYKSATVDAFAVPVMDYVEKVPAPTEGELLAYFDLHKNEYSDGELGKPGFKERKKAKIEMMFANVEKFAKPEEVTDAAVAAEYERVKGTEFVKRPGVDIPGVELPNMTENPFSDNVGETIQPETLPEGAASVTDETPESLPETIDIPENPAPAEDAPAAEEAAPAAAEDAPAVEAAAPAAAENAPAVEAAAPAPAENAPAVEAAAPAPAENAPAVEEAAPAPAENAPAVEAAAPAPAEDAPAVEAAAPAPAEDAPAVEEAAPAAAEDAPAVEAAAPAPENTSSKQSSKSPFRQVAFQPGMTIPLPNTPGMNPSTNPPVEYIPLEEVKESLRTRLARAAAVEKIQKRVREAMAELTAHQRAMQKYQTLQIRNEGKPVDTPKPTFDFADLANRYGFEYAELPLLDGVDIRALPIGKSQCEMGDYVTFIMGTLPEYQPLQSYDADFNVYVSWKTATVAAKVPQFTDEGVREKVLAAWKFEKARPLAEAAAKKMTEDCQATHSLASLGEKVFETGPFQWVSYGPQPEIYHSIMEPEISRVEKVDTDDRKNAGKEFMQAVFAAKEGDVTLATDRSRSTYYIVQVKKYLPTQETLQKMFTTTPLAYYKTAADADLRETGAKWLNQLALEAQVQWHRDPQTGRSESEE